MYFFFCILILCTRFPRLPYQRGWDCTAWWVSPCVGVSLCVDVRLYRVSSCTWRDGQVLVSRGLALVCEDVWFSDSPGSFAVFFFM